MQSPEATRDSKLIGLLGRYFASGWAFLLPYTVCYAIYARLGWPIRAQDSIVSLLRVFQCLHLLHAASASVWLLAMWRRRRGDGGVVAASAPWLMLLVILLVPGLYLEFPSDAWEHLRRINEWSGITQIAAHYTPNKSGYFLTYSLAEWVPASQQLTCLNAYCVFVNLLLCFQYYRLSLSAGVSREASFCFVIVQVLVFGNSTFSFYRYYPLASTVLAHIGTIAMIELGVRTIRTFPASFPAWTRLFCSASALLAIIAYNHVQGLGIAALAIASACAWRLIVWRRSMAYWLAAGVLFASAAAVAWLPRHPSIDALYRPQGWLTPVYGFNVFSLSSPAGERTLQILGFIGVCNAAAGFWLIARNQIVGWLTLGPMLALSTPIVAIPLASKIAQDIDPNYIITFHRMLLGIPAGLAIVRVAEHVVKERRACRRCAPAALILTACFVFTVLPAERPYYNRAWHALARVPPDLSLNAEWSALTQNQAELNLYGRYLAGTSPLCFVAQAQGPVLTMYSPRWHRHYVHEGRSPSSELAGIVDRFEVRPPSPVLVVSDPFIQITPYSFAAQCSGHWTAQESTLLRAGAAELKRMALAKGFEPREAGKIWLFLPPQQEPAGR